jgi:hypothetical protein
MSKPFDIKEPYANYSLGISPILSSKSELELELLLDTPSGLKAEVTTGAG